MTAMVSGLANTAVNWSVIGAGSIDANGLYSAPAMMPASNYVSILATSMMDQTISGSTGVFLKGAGPVLTSLSVQVSGGYMTLQVYGNGFQPGAWGYYGNVGTSTTYVSPTQVTVNGYVTAGMTGQVYVKNTTSMPSNMLNLTIPGGNAGAAPVVSPATISVVQGMTQQFNSTVQAVTWSATGGTITASGLFTAPAQVPNPPTITVTATDATSKSGSATVTILSNAPPTISSVALNPIPVGVFSTSATGTGFTATSTASLGGKALSTSFVSSTQLAISGYASTGGTSSISVSNGPIASAPFTVQVGVANPQVSAAAARRFLEQAAFGPSPADAQHVQQVGLQGWLNEQFAMPRVSNFLNLGNVSSMGPRFIANATMNPDQLRQRVAFVLSQFFVTSLNKITWQTDMETFQDMLAADAFSNYRQILGDVTLSGVMGEYLDMANSPKGNANGSVVANQNYAREVLQLFSIGTALLFPDGTPQVDGVGVPLPAYNQQTIAEFARVFTGWSYAPAPGKQGYFGNYIYTGAPMVAYPAYHDTGSKTLLNGVVLPPNQTPLADLNAALDNIFNHPNVGPYLAKQLIQHLVKSNPSPAYVGRVAAAFNDNGNGVRGDMKAVVTAVLMDVEARANDIGGQDLVLDGHLQEPALYISGIMRALSASISDQNYFANDLRSMGEDIYNAPSVFNYYSPFYSAPGAQALGPEFQIYSPYTAVYRANFISSFFYNYSALVQTSGPGATVDLTPLAALAGTPSALVDALDITFTHGTMPAAMKQTLVGAVTTEAGGNLRRVQTGMYLLLTSGYYNVWH